ncbi:MAG TPA: adenylate kinase [Candidatus Krumholzibacteria bacterium]|nr:adenylate kinase [Candidatus Krumholzibacteria bacterium]
MNLVLFGPPGSGKGTQAERLRNRWKLRHISTGDLLREAVAAKSELGKKVESVLASGQLVSDDIILGLMRGAILAVKQDAALSGWLLDGFPRTVGQAKGLDALLAETGSRIDAIVVLDATREAVVDRLSGRRTCTKCKTVYHITHNPTRVDGVCDKCGGKVVQREDDRPETIAKRLDVYEAQTRPILAHYAGRVATHVIDGDLPVDDVTAEIERIVGRAAA